MSEPFYLPRHDTQFEPRTGFSPWDCNMAAAADAARYWSIGLTDHDHSWYRKVSGDTDGGTNITTASKVLDIARVSHAVYDASDGRNYADVKAALDAGRFVIAHGDYDRVPVSLRGPIDRSYEGYHSVFAARRRSNAVMIGDGLSDKWMLWPDTVLSSYMAAFPGGGFTYIAVRPRHLRSKSGTCNIRAEATRQSRVVSTLRGTREVHYGGFKRGESIGGNSNWDRVWEPTHGVAYVHSSVAVPA
jgi:hypothetical protein